MDKPSTGDFLRLARERFGYESLLPGQEEGMLSVLEGRDTLVVMPTGSGKSAIYQIPALAIEGTTIVVSPLIALQRDQVDALAETGVVDAAHANSTMPDGRKDEVLERLEKGELEYLFLAPEQFASGDVLERVGRARPSLFVVDEAHCISEWGHDFRPEYLRLGSIVEEIGRPPVLALTATAAPAVRQEIAERLKMRDPNVIVRGFDRPNLELTVERFADERSKKDSLLEAVETSKKPGIVYVATRREAEELSAALWQVGVESVFYHGGMTASQRNSAQEAFMEDQFDVVVATGAFGMGIDKPDVRFVYHFDPPESIDSLYQELGRAGRDGQPSLAKLFFRSEDLGVRNFFAAGGRVDREDIEHVIAEVMERDEPVGQKVLKRATGLSESKLASALGALEKQGVVEVEPTGEVTPRAGKTSLEQAAEEAARRTEARKSLEESRVDMVRSYAETKSCRREFLLNYFGEPFSPPCGNCDNCICGRESGVAAEDGLAVGTGLGHSRWGQGTVVRSDGDKLTVLFENHGYKTLSRKLLAERGLLEG